MATTTTTSLIIAKQDWNQHKVGRPPNLSVVELDAASKAKRPGGSLDCEVHLIVLTLGGVDVEVRPGGRGDDHFHRDHYQVWFYPHRNYL